MQKIKNLFKYIKKELFNFVLILNCINSIFKREFLLTYRNFYDILSIITFFILGILIFIFAIGPENEQFSKVGIGIIWTLLLLSTNLSIKKFYQDDFNDGSIVLFFISGMTFEFISIIYSLLAFFSISFSYYNSYCLFIIKCRSE